MTAEREKGEVGVIHEGETKGEKGDSNYTVQPSR